MVGVTPVRNAARVTTVPRFENTKLTRLFVRRYLTSHEDDRFHERTDHFAG